MRNIKQKDAALSAFIAKKATIDAVLARLAGVNADHLRAFGVANKGIECRTRISPMVGEPTLCGRVQLASAIVQHLLCSLEPLEIVDRRPHRVQQWLVHGRSCRQRACRHDFAGASTALRVVEPKTPANGLASRGAIWRIEIIDNGCLDRTRP